MRWYNLLRHKQLSRQLSKPLSVVDDRILGGFRALGGQFDLVFLVKTRPVSPWSASHPNSGAEHAQPKQVSHGASEVSQRLDAKGVSWTIFSCLKDISLIMDSLNLFLWIVSRPSSLSYPVLRGVTNVNFWQIAVGDEK